MPDRFSPAVRSRIMRRIRASDTKPELAVRSFLHRAGLRFRLHCRNLPGKPDIVLPRFRTIVLVHGCFWHQHGGCRLAKIPKSNRRYWVPKLRRTACRDKVNRRALAAMGWKVLVIWECCISQRTMAALLSRITPPASAPKSGPRNRLAPTGLATR